MSRNGNGNRDNLVQVKVIKTNESNSQNRKRINEPNQNKNGCCQIRYYLFNFWTIIKNFIFCRNTPDSKYQQINAEQSIDGESSNASKEVSTSQQKVKTRNNEQDLSSDLLKKQTKPGGLYNSASTCYMNAMIQALSSSDILISSIESLSKSHSNSSVLLLYDLLNALNEENINNKNVMRNTKLLENLIESVGWTKLSQQDAFDLLSALICDIYKKSDDKDKTEIPLRIKLIHEFQGIDIGNRVQEHLGLSLNLCGNYQNPPGVPLQFLINTHFISSAIDGDKSKLTRSTLYREIPSILLIHIQANKWDSSSNQMVKPIYYIQYDENMTLWFDIANEIDGENRNLNEDRSLGTKVKYHLKSIVYHVGNISGGHYAAYRKWREEWYLADDDTIMKEPLNKSISPYMMIYERTSI